MSVFYHPEHKTLLIVYVDDFKMSGPAKGVGVCWKLIRGAETVDEDGVVEKAIMLGPVMPVDHHLVYDHAWKIMKSPVGCKYVNVMIHSMHMFFDQCISEYEGTVRSTIGDSEYAVVAVHTHTISK